MIIPFIEAQMQSGSHMRNCYIIGNWKMNGDQVSLATLIKDIQQTLSDISPSVRVGVCPPFVYLPMIHQLLVQRSSSILLGAQDVAEADTGAYTGQVSAAMLKDVGCQSVIVGHSERRIGLHEMPKQVAQKTAQALDNGLTPIVCLGETLEEQEQDATEQVIQRQLDPILALGPEKLKNMIFAYEPVWAIGTGKTATPEQAQQIHAFIRQEVAKQGVDVAQSLPILYGGSMKPDNALELLQCPDIDGGLIGGASLKALDFVSICQFAGQVSG